MSAPVLESPFATATTWTALGEDRYAGRVSPEWFQGRGAYGGLLGGLLLRSMMRQLAEPARVPRSLTVHFCAPVDERDALVTVRLERAGRQVSHLSARLEQGGQVACLASATFATAREPALTFTEATAPAVPPPDSLASTSTALMSAFSARFDYRWCLGGLPCSGGSEARTGAWLRPRLPEPLDAPLLVGLLDAFPPAAYARVEGPAVGATMDYTVHFPAPLPPVSPSPSPFFLRTGHSRHAAQGYTDELAELWSESGELLGQSRQMAAVFLQGR